MNDTNGMTGSRKVSSADGYRGVQPSTSNRWNTVVHTERLPDFASENYDISCVLFNLSVLHSSYWGKSVLYTQMHRHKYTDIRHEQCIEYKHSIDRKTLIFI